MDAKNMCMNKNSMNIGGTFTKTLGCKYILGHTKRSALRWCFGSSTIGMGHCDLYGSLRSKETLNASTVLSIAAPWKSNIFIFTC